MLNRKDLIFENVAAGVDFKRARIEDKRVI